MGRALGPVGGVSAEIVMDEQDKDEGIVLTEAQKRARRSRSIAIALALAALVDPVLRHDPGEGAGRPGPADMSA